MGQGFTDIAITVNVNLLSIKSLISDKESMVYHVPIKYLFIKQLISINNG